jgi:hypothetical protein
MASLQVRLVLGKKDERVAGPDDADVVVAVGALDATLDPTVAYMQGKLKATGHTGVLLDALRSGEIARALAELDHQAS